MSNLHNEVTQCRISGAKDLVSVLNLGDQALTGHFPSPGEVVPTAPLELVWSQSSELLQLRNSVPLSEMYGENYGYRSGLNRSMVSHLERKAANLARRFELAEGDLVVDVGSNDGTLLNSLQGQGLELFGFDPVGKKYSEFYATGVNLVPDFFSGNLMESLSIGKAKLITSISMFYDLEHPRDFVSAIKHNLASDGVWHFEQSYLPAMLRANAYDTVCHEHLEYYSLRVVNRLLEEEGLEILDVETNSVNGGSFAVTAAHSGSRFPRNSAIISWLLGVEERLGMAQLETYEMYFAQVFSHRQDLVDLVSRLLEQGKSIAGYGASTKGNVLLQHCGFTNEHLMGIGEVNPDKFGRLTPGSNIPILPEGEIRAMRPDYMLVLPWHFREGIIAREAEYLNDGGKLIFPLPGIEIVGA